MTKMPNLLPQLPTDVGGSSTRDSRSLSASLACDMCQHYHKI